MASIFESMLNYEHPQFFLHNYFFKHFPNTFFAHYSCNVLLFSLIIQGPGGVTVKKTTLALVIGIYDEPMTPGQCNMVVERLGDYLIEQGL